MKLYLIKIDRTILLNWFNEIVNVRQFSNQQIDERVKKDLYNAFLKGPASISTQARELYVINNQDKIENIIASTLDPYMSENSYGSQTWIRNAPFVSLVLIEKRRAMARVGEKGITIALQEAEAAIQNLRIMARFYQIKTACVKEFDEDRLKKNLKLPWYIRVVAILAAGYSDHPVDIPPRFSIDEGVSEGKWE